MKRLTFLHCIMPNSLAIRVLNRCFSYFSKLIIKIDVVYENNLQIKLDSFSSCVKVLISRINIYDSKVSSSHAYVKIELLKNVIFSNRLKMKIYDVSHVHKFSQDKLELHHLLVFPRTLAI